MTSYNFAKFIISVKRWRYLIITAKKIQCLKIIYDTMKNNINLKSSVYYSQICPKIDIRSHFGKNIKHKKVLEIKFDYLLNSMTAVLHKAPSLEKDRTNLIFRINPY